MASLLHGHADPRTSWYRQRVSEPSVWLGIIPIALLAYTFAGFLVFWLVTGSTTIGKGGTVTSLGELVWFGPIFAFVPVMVIGPRGPFARLYGPRVDVGVDHDHLWWTRGGATDKVGWGDVLGINMSARSAGAGEALTVWDMAGRAVVDLPESLSRIGRRGSTTLQQLAVATRPDLFVRIGGFWRQAVAIRKDLPADD